MVVSMQPQGFSDYSKDNEETVIESTNLTNDRGVVGPIVQQQQQRQQCSSRYALDDDDDDDNKDDDDDDDETMKVTNDQVSIASSSSTLPSLNDLDFGLDPILFDKDDTKKGNNNNKFGGLNNMGNTCYLNSAIQMVASLDKFQALLTEISPENGNSNLRDLLIDVLQRLDKGEIFRPSDLKREIDEKTPLFIGYRQQDSHEFLTTLLDLIDEDYKKQEEEEEQQQQQKEDDSENNNMDQDGGDDDDETTTNSIQQNKQQQLQQQQLQQQPTLAQHEEESAHKRQRVEEEPYQCSSSLPTVRSFKDLQFDDIEALLHGNKTSTAHLPPEMMMMMERQQQQQQQQQQQEPKCKLVGGRMDMSGASLTAWDGHYVANNEQKNTSSKTTSQQQQGESSDDDSTTTATVLRNPVDSTFTTEVRVCLTCDSCKYRRSHNETYLHLSLEIGPNCSSVEDGLRKFFEPEKLEIKCEKCFCETATQTTEITRLPSALLLHLKRFIVDVSPDYSSISYRKNQSPVLFDEELPILDDDDEEEEQQQQQDGGVLSEFLAADVTIPDGDMYSIRSVVNHIGSSASCGHYTADGNRQYGSTQREWMRFNDEYVFNITPEDAIQNSTQTAYMIMYEIQSKQHNA